MNDANLVPLHPKPKLLDRVRGAIRSRHYSRRTEDAYVHWIKRFIFFHGVRHPAEMGEAEVTRFLSSLAVDLRVSASTQNQALSALLFLYKEVLDQPLPWLDDLVHAQTRRRLPVVLTQEEVHAVLALLQGVPRVMVTLLYGTGMRLLECCRLRVKDVDFGANQILVRGGKGDKDRVTLLPLAVRSDLGRHLEFVRAQHQRDVERGAGWVELPLALGRKYPNAAPPTCTSRSCSAPSRRLSGGPTWPSRHPVTRSGTRSRPIFLKTGTTSGRSRNSWAILTLVRR